VVRYVAKFRGATLHFPKVVEAQALNFKL